MRKIKVFTPHIGQDIREACKEAVSMAMNDRCYVKLKFNGQTLIATPETNPDQLAQSYSDESERLRREYIASPEYKARQEEAERKDRERKAKVEDMLAKAPEHMTLRDTEGWSKACDANKDGYGGAVMTYAERWARLMEARMAKGERIADIADECSHLADEEGISGYMYGCAVRILSKVWRHGEALRLWHNLKTNDC